MRILVTGSSGLLGRTIVDLLRSRHEAIGLDLVDGPTTTIRASITDREAVVRALEGVEAMIHTAALHAPHVPRFSRREFVDANIGGALTVLEASLAAGVRQVVYTSTTSLYGSALIPTDRAVWVTEKLHPIPRDIYDLTKLAAEELCRDVERAGLPVACLRIARCFPEPPEQMAINLLSRAVDIRDAAAAHVLAVEHPMLSGTFNIAARSAFGPDDLEELPHDAPSVIARYYPWAGDAFARRGWRLPERIERVYVATKAETGFGFRPAHDFAGLFPGEIALGTTRG